MRRPNKTLAERYELVMECRRSGLSDHRWCEEHGISNSTFYNWVKRLQKEGCDLPAPAGADTYAPEKMQDVVKLEVIDDYTTTPANEYKYSPVSSTAAVNPSASIEISLNNAVIRIGNDVDPSLLTRIIAGIGGVSC